MIVFFLLVNGILGAGSYGIAMPKHSPYIRNISVAILKLQETSVLDSLWRKWWEYKSQCPKEKSGSGVCQAVNLLHSVTSTPLRSCKNIYSSQGYVQEYIRVKRT